LAALRAKGLVAGWNCGHQAFEFRWRDPRHRALWNVAFTSGSVVVALAQGMILGAILQGVTVVESAEAGGWAYAGGWLDWLTPSAY